MDRYFEIGHRIRLAGIDGEYEVKELAGKGASCIVYRTIFTNKDGFVTEHLLKEYNPSYLGVSRNEDGCLFTSEEDHSAFEDGMKRFKAGYKLQADIRERIREVTNSTSNIQNTFSGFGTQYIDMTLINGETYSKVQEKSLFDLLRRVKAITQVIGSYHKAGYLHLDIKPDNIFTIPETCELVVLFDFDSVTEKAEVLNSRGLSYTQSWAAPEQINIVQRKNICEATDLYAIGEVVFWKIFGRHSVDEEHWSFCEYDFAIDSPIFKNVNPKVFPILTELFHKTICVSVKERYQSAEELIEKLDDLIKLADPKEPYLVSKAITPNAFFIGRDRELSAIHEKLQKDPKLFLSGIGGIGKTELAKNYAVRYKDSYDTILFATFTGSWMTLINDDGRIQIANFERYEGEKEPEYCAKKLRMLAKLCDQRTLFIIDNLNEDEFYDEEQKRWESILGLNCKFIFTTRIGDWPYPSIPVDKLERHQDSVDLYGNYCEISDGQQSVVDSIIEYVDGHTLTIELIAKLISTSHFSPEMVLQKLNEYGIAQSGKEKVVMDKDNARRRKAPFDHICAIFDMTRLSDVQLYIMANMALIPPDGIETELFENWCELKDFDEVNDLAGSGWLGLEQANNIVKMHPVVAEVAVVHCLIDTPNCCNVMLRNIQNTLDNCTNTDVGYSPKDVHKYVIVFNSVAKSITKSGIATKNVARFLNASPHFIVNYGYLVESLKYCQKALEIRQNIYGKEHVDIASSFDNIGVLYRKLGNLEQAEQYCRKAYEIYHKLLGDEHADVATSLDNLGCVFGSKGDFALAKKCCKKALMIRHKIYGEEHADVALSLNNLGFLYKTQGKLEQAEQYYLSAYEILHRLSGENCGNSADILSNLGVLYKMQGKLNQAEQCYSKAIETRYKLFGEEHAAVAVLFNNLGVLYDEQGNIEQAEQYYLKAYELSHKLFGENHPQTATSLSNLSTLYEKQGDLAEAQRYQERALGIYQTLYGEDHTDIAFSLNNLGTIYMELGNMKRAKKYFSRAYAIWNRLLGENHPQTAAALDNLGCLHEKQGNFVLAEKYHEKALMIRRKIYGEKHADTALSLNNLGFLYCEQGNLEKAERYFLAAYKIRNNLFGEEHADVAMSLNNLGALYDDQGKLKKAERYYLKAYEIQKKLFGKKHADVALSLNNLGVLYQKQGELKKAEKCCFKAYKILHQLFGEGHEDVALAIDNLGSLYEQDGNLENAKLCYQKSYKIRKRLLGDKHQDTISTLDKLDNLKE